MLRPVSDESPALSEDELQERGNELVTLARSAAIAATGKSMHPEFVQRGRPLHRADIVRWRQNAREAISAWREAEGHLTEIINELDKKSAQFRATHRQETTTDDGVNYRTEWVPKDSSSTGEKS